MKRNIIKLMAIGLIVCMLFVSCDNGISEKKGLSEVKFMTDDNLARGLNAVYPEFQSGNLYWRYEALKMDDSGLKTGETSGEVAVSRTSPVSAGLSESVGPFSLGEWKFVLHGYTDAAFQHEVYTGYRNDVVISEQSGDSVNSVKIKVQALQKGAGTISIADDITVRDGSGNPVKVSQKITDLKFIADPQVTATPAGSDDGYTNYTAKSGSWSVTISITNGKTEADEIVYATNTIYVNVVDNQPTLITGSLDEITSDTQFVPTMDGGLKAPVVEMVPVAATPTSFTVKSSPMQPESTDKDTIVTFPADVLPEGKTASLTVTTYQTPAANAKLNVINDFGPIACIDLSLTVDGVAMTDFPEGVKIQTYIAPDFYEDEIAIYYNGDSVQPTFTYDDVTGLLEFTVKHFSEYYILLDFTEYSTVNLRTNEYGDFRYIVNNAVTGDEVFVLSDDQFSGSPGALVTIDGKNLTIDLNNNTIHSTRGGGQILVKNGGTLTIKNGTLFKNSGGTKLPDQAMINLENGNLIIENGNFTTEKDLFNIVYMENNSSVVINDGHFYSEKDCIIQTHGTDVSDNRITINGGTFDGRFLYMPSNGVVTINGGTFNGTDCVLYQKCGELNITGGDFSTSRGDGLWAHNGSGAWMNGDVVVVEACDYPGNPPRMNITGGTFTPYAGDPNAAEPAPFKNYGILAIDWVPVVKPDGYQPYHVDTSGTTVTFQHAGDVFAGSFKELPADHHDCVYFNDSNTTTYVDGKAPAAEV